MAGPSDAAAGPSSAASAAGSDTRAQLRADPRFPSVLIHESAYVDDPCMIGEGTRMEAQVPVGTS